jgi:hypothetical protein
MCSRAHITQRACTGLTPSQLQKFQGVSCEGRVKVTGKNRLTLHRVLYFNGLTAVVVTSVKAINRLKLKHYFGCVVNRLAAWKASRKH